MNKTLAAFTPVGHYPPFINISETPTGDVVITMRGTPVEADEQPPTVSMTLSRAEFSRLFNDVEENCSDELMDQLTEDAILDCIAGSRE